MTDTPDERSEREAALTSRLHVLTRQAPDTSGWLNPDVIRRQVVRCRRRRLAFGGTSTAVVAAIVVTLALTSGGSSGPPVPVAKGAGVRVGARIDGAVQLVSDAGPSGVFHGPEPEVEPVVRAQQTLAIKLLQSLGDPDRNTSVSPSSLQYALAMLENGARATTQTQIAKALQTPALSPDEQNAELAALTGELADAARGHLALDTANSIWQQRGFPVRRAFLASLASYDAGIWQTDFRTSQALKAINHWTDTRTDGRIPRLFDSLDPRTVLVVANALYLHADWQQPFNKSETVPARFVTASGRRVTAQFMVDGGATAIAQTPTYDAAQLPYRGGRFAALVVMPRRDSLARFTTELTPARLTGVVRSLATPRSGIGLPRFTTRTTTELIPTLRSLGMRQAFGPGADFSPLSAEPGLSVGQVVQRVYVRVNEKGTTAAAATGVAVALSGSETGPVMFDRPFLFLIRDRVTGAIIFASRINNPVAG